MHHNIIKIFMLVQRALYVYCIIGSTIKKPTWLWRNYPP